MPGRGFRRYRIGSLWPDSFPLYVYDADALKVQDDKGDTISKLTMDNTSKVSGSLPTRYS